VSDDMNNIIKRIEDELKKSGDKIEVSRQLLLDARFEILYRRKIHDIEKGKPK